MTAHSLLYMFTITFGGFMPWVLDQHLQRPPYRCVVCQVSLSFFGNSARLYENRIFHWVGGVPGWLTKFREAHNLACSVYELWSRSCQVEQFLQENSVSLPSQGFTISTMWAYKWLRVMGGGRHTVVNLDDCELLNSLGLSKKIKS